MKGLDISSYQGGINFDAIKSAGVEFLILRAGFTGWGTGVNYNKDTCFEEFYNKSKSHNIPVGAYWYSCANTKEKGIAEAKYMYENCLKGKQFEFPIYIDVEDTHHQVGNKRGVTDAIIGFCEYLENLGYYAGIYASDISGFQDKMYLNELDAYDKWVARYGSEPKYVKQYGMWQLTSSGRINGYNGNLDCDIAYKDYSSIIKNAGLNGFAKESNSAPQPTRKSNEEIATEVINGVWGNGQDRKNNLAAAGYDYNAIQTIVNNKLGVTNKPQNNELWVTVQRGDTLWGLASKYYGNGSQYRAIKILNGLSSDLIRVGQRLRIK